MCRYLIYELRPGRRGVKRRIYERRLFADDSAVRAEVARLNDVESSLPAIRRVRYTYAAA